MLACITDTRAVCAVIAWRSASGLTTPAWLGCHKRQGPAAARQVLARIEDGLVFDGASDQVPAPARLERLRDAPDGEIVRLRAAGRPHEVVGLGAEERGDTPPAPRSRSALAFCPNACTLDALPKSSASAWVMASRTAGWRGVVALWSK